MQTLVHHTNNAAFNIDCDETLLSISEKTGQSFLRIWEAAPYFVVLGRSNQLEIEAKKEHCLEDGIPILKRCSGGGTVLQGNGCLNYALVLSIEKNKNLHTITSTTNWIMTRHQQAFSKHLDEVSVQGISDLTWKGRKFSGNAQRRLRKSVLFHGTILYNFNLEKIESYLKFPSRVPDYRNNKSHLEFVTNIPIRKDDLIRLLKTTWEDLNF